MRAVETAIRDMLTSGNNSEVLDGLANVIYWGYAQIGYRDTRVRRFRENATEDQLNGFRALLKSPGEVGLATVAALTFSEFSGISFVSKVLTFLDPVKYYVLDKQLLKLAECPGNRALHRVSAGTQIRVTTKNQEAYDAWRHKCAAISIQYFKERYCDATVHRALRLKAAETDQSVSVLVNDAVKLSLAEDADDLETIAARAPEPSLAFETVVRDLRRRGKL